MKKNNKKGFTIVELVIVIAVIGVLAAILIPTFINLNNKARVANTTSFLKNVNTQLAMKEANHDIDDYDAKYDEKGRFASNYYAKEYAKQKLGYDFDLISPFDGNEICWDKNNKKFGLVDYSDEANPTEVYADVKVEEHDWQRLSNDPVQTKGILQRGEPLTLKDNFSKEELTALGSEYYDPATETLKVNGTAELGNNPNVKVLEYENDASAKNVTLQSASASVNISVKGYVDPENNTKGDSVQHYGLAGSLNVISVPKNSYHEYGQIAFAEISAGRIVLEEESVISQVHINKNESTGEFDEIVIKDNGASELPKTITRDEVEVTGDSIDVVTVETREGVQETVKVYADGTTGTTQKTETQNTDVNSALGQLVLDNGSESKALNEETKEEAKTEVIDVLAGEEVAKNPEVENYAARIGTTGYLTFVEAYNSAVAGNKIVLLNNVLLGDIIEGNYVQENYTSGFNFTKAGITLDLNGKSLVSNVNVGFAFDVISGDLTIKDSVGTGMIRATRAPVVVHCGSSATVNVYGGTILAEYADPDVYNTAALDVDGTANIYGGTFSSQTDWEYEYEGDIYYFFSFSINNRNITHIYGGTFISKHKNEGGNGLANCRDLYIHDDITIEGLYWTNDNGKKTTKIEVAEGKTLTVEGAYDCQRVSGGKTLTLTGNLVYDPELFIEE